MTLGLPPCRSNPHGRPRSPTQRQRLEKLRLAKAQAQRDATEEEHYAITERELPEARQQWKAVRGGAQMPHAQQFPRASSWHAGDGSKGVSMAAPNSTLKWSPFSPVGVVSSVYAEQRSSY